MLCCPSTRRGLLNPAIIGIQTHGGVKSAARRHGGLPRTLGKFLWVAWLVGRGREGVGSGCSQTRIRQRIGDRVAGETFETTGGCLLASILSHFFQVNLVGFFAVEGLHSLH